MPSSSPDRLRRLWRRRWSGRSGVSTVLLYEGGIHRLANLSAEPAVSVYLYGPRSGEIDGRNHDPLATTSVTGRRGFWLPHPEVALTPS